jgi:hypothetical protein
MDLFMCIGPKEIVFLLWEIFLDSREFFAHQIEDTDDLPESSLRYTTSFLGVGRIPTDLLGVPLNQFLVASLPHQVEEEEEVGAVPATTAAETSCSKRPHMCHQSTGISQTKSAP